MDYRHIIDYAAIAVLIAWLIGPLIRRYLHILVFKKAHYQAGIPSVVCSKCHSTTTVFRYLPEGGAYCGKCSNWG